jgi:hypothetical protein
MCTLSQAIASVVVAFAPLFSKRVFVSVKLLLISVTLAPAKRTVTAVS